MRSATAPSTGRSPPATWSSRSAETGTILHAAKHAVEYQKPILGINTGRLGYLAQVEPNELEYLARLSSGDYTIQDRMLLEVEIDGVPGVRHALNDVVISKGELSRLVDLDIESGGRPVGSYRADGSSSRRPPARRRTPSRRAARSSTRRSVRSS